PGPSSRADRRAEAQPGAHPCSSDSGEKDRSGAVTHVEEGGPRARRAPERDRPAERDRPPAPGADRRPPAASAAAVRLTGKTRRTGIVLGTEDEREVGRWRSPSTTPRAGSWTARTSRPSRR